MTFGRGFIQAASSSLIDHDLTKSFISSRFRPISANVLSSSRFSEETALEYSNQALRRPRKVGWLSFAAFFAFVIGMVPFMNDVLTIRDNTENYQVEKDSNKAGHDVATLWIYRTNMLT